MKQRWQGSNLIAKPDWNPWQIVLFFCREGQRSERGPGIGLFAQERQLCLSKQTTESQSASKWRRTQPPFPLNTFRTVSMGIVSFPLSSVLYGGPVLIIQAHWTGTTIDWSLSTPCLVSCSVRPCITIYLSKSTPNLWTAPSLFGFTWEDVLFYQ